jgi:hypothetical protein
MKYCPGCLRDLPEADFGKNKAAKDALNYKCKMCVRARDREYYKQNPKRRYDTSTNIRSQRLRNKKFVIEYLKSHPCELCGEADPLVLEFDHLDRKTKYKMVSTLVHQGCSLEKITEEIKNVVFYVLIVTSVILPNS